MLASRTLCSLVSLPYENNLNLFNICRQEFRSIKGVGSKFILMRLVIESENGLNKTKSLLLLLKLRYLEITKK